MRVDVIQMPGKFGDSEYHTSKKLRKISPFPSVRFYFKLLTGPLQWLCRRASRGTCDDAAWAHGSVWVADILEKSGGTIEVEGLKAFTGKDGPYVIIANHMSTLETFLLPGIIRPLLPVTFVVKKSLTTMPFFGPIMRSRDPVAVGRKNPREDLEQVLTGGAERLSRGISIVVFPQSTRSINFERDHFNTIGVKLARRARAKVVPLALKTDAWGQGRKIKELGKIRPDLPARFRFGEPLEIVGNGKKEHEAICNFIETTLKAWQAGDGINS